MVSVDDLVDVHVEFLGIFGDIEEFAEPRIQCLLPVLFDLMEHFLLLVLVVEGGQSRTVSLIRCRHENKLLLYATLLIMDILVIMRHSLFLLLSAQPVLPQHRQL